jgi:hypothetical protein
MKRCIGAEARGGGQHMIHTLPLKHILFLDFYIAIKINAHLWVFLEEIALMR